MLNLSVDLSSSTTLNTPVVKPDTIRDEIDIEKESQRQHAAYCNFLDQSLALSNQVSDVANHSVDYVI